MVLIKLSAGEEGISQNVSKRAQTFCQSGWDLSKFCWKLLEECVDFVKQDLGDQSVLLLEQVGFLKLWWRVGFLLVGVGLIKCFVVVGRIGHVLLGMGKIRENYSIL